MPTLKKKRSQNIFNTIKKIDKVAIENKKEIAKIEDKRVKHLKYLLLLCLFSL